MENKIRYITNSDATRLKVLVNLQNMGRLNNQDKKYIEDLKKEINMVNLVEPKDISKDANTYYNNGNAYGRKGLYDEAIKDYTKAIQVNPKYAEAYYNRGIAYYKKGLTNLSISNWKKAVDLGYEEARQNLKEFYNIDY
jgi:tetratricopeptide (TPR) repeat protein